MRKLVTTVVLALAAAYPAPAHAAPSIAGLTCGLVTTSDFTLLLENPGTQVGVVFGGPVAGTGTVGIQCSIQVGGTGVHSDPDIRTEPPATGSLAAVVPPALVAYNALPNDPVWVCTQVTENGTTYYYDAPSGNLSTSNAAHCTLAISFEVPPCGVVTGVCEALDMLCGTSLCDFPADVRVSPPAVFTKT